MTRPCVAVLVIFNNLPCSGITGGVQLKGCRSNFQSFPYSGARIEALRTVMVPVFTVAVGIVKTINFSYTIRPILSTSPIYVGFRPTFLVLVSLPQLNRPTSLSTFDTCKSFFRTWLLSLQPKYCQDYSFEQIQRQIFTNYRPISILTFFSKILEKLIGLHSRLTNFFDKHFVASSTQYGFRKHHSTSHAVADVVTPTYDNINNNECTGLVFLDLKKNVRYRFPLISFKQIKSLRHSRTGT